MKAITLALLFVSSPVLHADDLLSLSDGEKLSGSIQSISEDKTLTMSHTSSKEPLLIDLSAIGNIKYNDITNLNEVPPESMIHLSNGDYFPAKIKNLQEDHVTVNTSLLGEIKIKRSDIESIRFGSSIQNKIYDLNITKKTFSKNNKWFYKDRSLSSSVVADMWEALPLTENFILKGTLKWANSPSITFHLAAKGASVLTSNKRYNLLLESSKASMILYSAGKQETRTASNMRLNMHNGSVKFEIWVSQTSGKVTLVLDEKIHTFAFTNTPNGISTWDGKIAPSEIVKLGSKDHDFVVTKNDNRFSGKILASQQEPSDQSIKIPVQFKNDPDDPKLLNKSDIQIIKFAKTKKVENQNLTPSTLMDNSSLTFTQVVQNGDQLTLSHPLMGVFKISKQNLSQLNLNN